MKRNNGCLFFLVLGVLTIPGCGPSLPAPAVEADAAANTLRVAELHYGLLQAPLVNHYLSQLTQRLAAGIFGTALGGAVSRKDIARAADYSWHIFVLRTSAVNAYSLGAGQIVVTKGMFLAAPAEDVFAAVVAHEMAHQILGHTREALMQVKQSGRPEAFFSLEQELAADALSLKLLALGGFDPAAAAQAITIQYRQFPENVAYLPPDWLVQRMSSIEQQLNKELRAFAIGMSEGEYAAARKLVLRASP